MAATNTAMIKKKKGKSHSPLRLWNRKRWVDFIHDRSIKNTFKNEIPFMSIVPEWWQKSQHFNTSANKTKCKNVFGVNSPFSSFSLMDLCVCCLCDSKLFKAWICFLLFLQVLIYSRQTFAGTFLSAAPLKSNWNKTVECAHK